MTEVLFYHLHQRGVDSVLPSLLEKSLARGWRVVIESPSRERIDALDAHLWTYRDDGFLPHGLSGLRDSADQPVLLTTAADNGNGAAVRVLVDGAPLPDEAEAYERILLVFNGDEDEEREAARGTWRLCRDRGLAATYWQADESGRWQKMG
jgi:DNA polymerase-3 subunit chi